MGRNEHMTVKQYGRQCQRVVVADNWLGSDNNDNVFSFSSGSDSNSFIQTRNRSRQMSGSAAKKSKKNSCSRVVNKENRYKKRKVRCIFPLSESSTGSEKTASIPKRKCRKTKRHALKTLSFNNSTNFSEFDEYSLLVDLGTSYDNDDNNQKRKTKTSSVETSTPYRAVIPLISTPREIKDMNVSLISYVPSPLNGSWCGTIPHVGSPLMEDGCDSLTSDRSSMVSNVWGVSEIIPSPAVRSRSAPIFCDLRRSNHCETEVRESENHFEKEKTNLLTELMDRSQSVSRIDYLQQSQDLFDSSVFTSSLQEAKRPLLKCTVFLNALSDSFIKRATTKAINIPNLHKPTDFPHRGNHVSYSSDHSVADSNKSDDVLDERDSDEIFDDESDEYSENELESQFDLSEIQERDEDQNSSSTQEESLHENSSSMQEESLHENSSSMQEESLHKNSSSMQEESLHKNSSSMQEESLHQNSTSMQEESLHQNSTSMQEESLLQNSTSMQEESLLQNSTSMQEESLLQSMADLSMAEEGAYHTASGGETSLFYSANSTRNNDESPKPLQLESRKNSCIQEMSLSFAEMLTPTKRKSDHPPLSPRSKILKICQQKHFVPFKTCIPNGMMKTIVKIGEGTYGEVFCATRNRQSVAIKIIPIEGDLEVNDEPQKLFSEILSEVVISKELSNLRHQTENQTENFCEVKRVSCVQDPYPAQLLKQWDLYDKAKQSENDRPDQFDSDQIFMVLEFADGGQDLESFQFDNPFEARSVLQQVCMSLAVAEESLKFEHRDLHIGNVLVRHDDRQHIACRIDNVQTEIQSHGVVVSIIDFTFSRLRKDGCTVYFDLAQDDTLFDGSGDYQFDIYRKMKECNNNLWEPFNCYSNVLWIHYLCDKILKKKKYVRNGRNDRKALRDIQMFSSEVLTFLSAKHIVFESQFFK